MGAILGIVYSCTQEASERSKPYSTRDLRDRASEDRVNSEEGQRHTSDEPHSATGAAGCNGGSSFGVEAK